MDAEACISAQSLKINKEAVKGERGLLTHRVWSLGWQLSRILKPTHNVKNESVYPSTSSDAEQHFSVNAL